MLFTNRKINLDLVTVKMGDALVSRVSAITFLGINIDDKLTWNNHIGVICNKLSKNIGVMYKLKSLPKKYLPINCHAIYNIW